MKNVLFAALFLACCLPAVGQKMLLLEKYGRPNPSRIYPGQTLNFKLKNHPGWYKRELTDVLPEQKSVVLDLEIVRLDEISDLRLHRGIFRALGSSLLTFTASLGIVTGVAALRGDDIPRFWLPVGIGSAVGGAIMIRDKGKRIRLGRRHNLRALELTVPTSVRPN